MNPFFSVLPRHFPGFAGRKNAAFHGRRRGPRDRAPVERVEHRHRQPIVVTVNLADDPAVADDRHPLARQGAFEADVDGAVLASPAPDTTRRRSAPRRRGVDRGSCGSCRDRICVHDGRGVINGLARGIRSNMRMTPAHHLSTGKSATSSFQRVLPLPWHPFRSWAEGAARLRHRLELANQTMAGRQSFGSYLRFRHPIPSGV